MARATFVKKARKDHPGGIKKGDSYYWWSFRFGGTHYSKTPPKQSQLTGSEFLSQAYEFGERMENGIDPNDVTDLAEEIRALGEEQDEKLNNMPEGLQEGPTGELLQQRVEACEEWASSMDEVFDTYENDTSEADGLEADDDEDEDALEVRKELARTEARETFDEEISNHCSYEGE